MSRFRFKQFSVEHRQSTMKVGTDAVMLGAWASPPPGNRILDIGTGCGVIALILANRFPTTEIVAIEPDDLSAAEASSNFKESPWSHQMSVANTSLQKYCAQKHQPFHLIVSNPPWFNNSLKVSNNPRRNNARHSDTLSFEELILGAFHLSTPCTLFATILPFSEATGFINLACEHGWHLNQRCSIKPKAEKPVHRMLLQFGRYLPDAIDNHHLIIQNPDGHFTDDYQNLTKKFYLSF